MVGVSGEKSGETNSAGGMRPVVVVGIRFAGYDDGTKVDGELKLLSCMSSSGSTCSAA